MPLKYWGVPGLTSLPRPPLSWEGAVVLVPAQGARLEWGSLPQTSRWKGAVEEAVLIPCRVWRPSPLGGSRGGSVPGGGP